MTLHLPEIGAPAPDFTLPGVPGGDFGLSAPLSGPVVLFFYPKDNTPGCTTEALEFSAALPEFHAAGAEVLGISKDSLQKHANFRAKHRLTVRLLSDQGSDVCERYGVWGEKKNYGKTYFGITRTTFLIGPDARILQVWPKVRLKGHVAEVLAAVKALRQ